MYVDQHTLEKMGTARLITRYAPDYTDYLRSVFGREFVFSAPAEIKGTVRLLAKFVAAKAASGEHHAPFIHLWVEFNPAMGLYTLWGEYWTDEDAKEPAYRSSPRSGFDDELLGNPARVFDWLDQSVSFGESKMPTLPEMIEALEGVDTPAGAVSVLIEEEDGVAVIVLEPEYRVPEAYYVSGTMFPNPGPADDAFNAKSSDDWFSSYVSPVQAAIQATLDGLYGVDTFTAEVDSEGFAFVKTEIPPLKQESRSWFATEMRRMAGVDGSERRDDLRLTEKAKPKAKPTKKVGPFSTAPTPERTKLAKKLASDPSVRDPERLAFWIGLRAAGKRSKQESVKPNLEQRMSALLTSPK
jgi:hypothetical protein